MHHSHDDYTNYLNGFFLQILYTSQLKTPLSMILSRAAICNAKLNSFPIIYLLELGL